MGGWVCVCVWDGGTRVVIALFVKKKLIIIKNGLVLCQRTVSNRKKEKLWETKIRSGTAQAFQKLKHNTCTEQRGQSPKPMPTLKCATPKHPTSVKKAMEGMLTFTYKRPHRLGAKYPHVRDHYRWTEGRCSSCSQARLSIDLISGISLRHFMVWAPEPSFAHLSLAALPQQGLLRHGALGASPFGAVIGHVARNARAGAEAQHDFEGRAGHARQGRRQGPFPR